MVMENERSPRQEDGEFEAKLVSLAGPCLKNKTTAANQLVITVKLSLRERLNILIHLTEKSKRSLTLNTSRFRRLKDDIIYCVTCPIFWLIWVL